MYYKSKPGIYKIICEANNKIYIGSSKDINRRINGHFKALRKNKAQILLQRSYNKYGEECFKIEILEYYDEFFLEQLKEREQYYIDLYKSYERDKGFNILPIAYSFKYRKGSKEEGRKKSESLKIMYANNPELKKKLSDLKKGSKNPMYGKKLSKDHKEKISKGNKNKIFSIERKKNISNSLKNKLHTKERIQNMSKPRSEKGKNNIKNAMSKYIKKIYQYDLNWKLLKIWNSSNEINENLGFLRNSISYVARKNKKFKNYFWSYNLKLNND